MIPPKIKRFLLYTTIFLVGYAYRGCKDESRIVEMKSEVRYYKQLEEKIAPHYNPYSLEYKLGDKNEKKHR